jgi:hypothetical protein
VEKIDLFGGAGKIVLTMDLFASHGGFSVFWWFW